MLSAKVKSAALAGLAILASFSANATSGSVAVVNFGAVLEGSKHVEAVQKSMQKKLGDKQQELILQHQTLAKEQNDLEKSKAVTSTASYNKKQAALEEKQKALSKKERDFQEVAIKTQEESMKKLFDLVKSASAKIAANKGIDLVLNAEALFAKGQYDITKEVRAEVEKSKLS